MKQRAAFSSITKRVFALSFTSEFIVIYPLYVIMFGQRGGVSAAGIGALLAIWMVVSVLAEVPTGVIADKFSKKWSLVLGRILQFLTFAIWLVAPSFAGYLAGFVVWGIGEAFLSGAFQAYLYESLDEQSKKSFGKIYSRSNAFTMMAYMVAGLLAFLIGPHYNLLLLLSMAVSLVSLGLTLSLPSTRSQVELEVRPKVLASALRAIRDTPALRNIILVAIVLQALMGMLGEYMPAYYQQVGVPINAVPLLMSVGSGAAALLYWWMHHIESQLAKYQAAIMVGFLVVFGLSCVGGGTTTAVVGFFIFTRMLRMMTVHNESQMQHHAPNATRATIGSLYSFVGKILSAGIISLIGVFAVQNKIVVPLRWSVVVGILIYAVFVSYSSVWRKKIVVVSGSKA